MAWVEKANDDAGGDAVERREIRRIALNDGPKQQHQRNHGGPAFAERLAEARNFFGRQPLQTEFLGLKMHLNKDAPEMHEGRHGSSDQQRCQRDIQEFNHHKGRGPHDGRRDLPASTGSGFHRSGELRAIANAFHRGNGQRADRDSIGNGRTADHAK